MTCDWLLYHPHFLSASSWELAPDVEQSYDYKRISGDNPEDVTSFHPGQKTWSIEKPPAILYMFRPTKMWKECKFSRRNDMPCMMENGEKVLEKWPQPGKAAEVLHDFTILPERIGTNEEWWVLEAWKRLDPRIQWTDIVMRMSNPKPDGNTLNMRCKRGRQAHYILAWHSTGREDAKEIAKITALLTGRQLSRNTTYGLTPSKLTATHDARFRPRKFNIPRSTTKKIRHQARGHKGNDDETDENSSIAFGRSLSNKPPERNDKNEQLTKEPQYDSDTDNHKFTFGDDGPIPHGIRYPLLEEILPTRPSFMIPGVRYNDHWTQEFPGLWNR